ncbi:unnamed protein product [Agarophyton chilense]|eukprot:gb/GEZJ01000737.1/.p1 GENE.gb/GEZJ01000737.1/~~gb/GEZJ01000737.1/.p1  ORF type:complete len:973 (-),score=117.18 gb/GEZJ01000737.1/:4312-7230(-)
MPSGRKRFTRIEDFYILETLGVGSFAKVRLAIHCGTHERYACKILDKSFIRQRDQNRHVKNEIDSLARLNHKNVVQLVDVINTAKRIYIIMELVSGGELFDVITKNRLSEPQVRFYFHQLVEGLHYCHRRGVFHRDLKLENILLSTEGVVKITDFGLSQLWAGQGDGMDSVNSSFLLSTRCGSPFYVAPEVVLVKEQRYSGAKADAWACGIILYVLAAGSLPFHMKFFEILSNGNNAVMLQKFIHGGINYPESFSEELRDLVNHLLELDPDKRYAMPAIKKHPWFNGPRDDPGRHRSELPQSQLPQVVAASLGTVPLTQLHTSLSPEKSATLSLEDELMETKDSLNLGKRVDSFEGTAPAVLLPMASQYSDAPEVENTTNEQIEPSFDIQQESHGVRFLEPNAGAAGQAEIAHIVPGYINGLQQIFEPQGGATMDIGMAFHSKAQASQYTENNVIIHNWNVLPYNFEVGEYIHLLSKENEERADDRDKLLRTYSSEVRTARSLKPTTLLEKPRSEPVMKPIPPSNRNVHPFQNLSKESKEGTVRQQLWELSMNQWWSKHVSEPEDEEQKKHCKTSVQGSPLNSAHVAGQEDDDYHLVGDSVEFELPNKVLKDLWTDEAIFGLIHDNRGGMQVDPMALHANAQNHSVLSVLKKSFESIPETRPSKPISLSRAPAEADILPHRKELNSSSTALRTGDFKAHAESSRNESTTTTQYSGKGSSRSPEIERLQLTEKESLGTRYLQGSSSGPGRRLPSSPRTPRSNKDSRRFRSGHSVERALLDVSGGFSADQGTLRETHSAHQSKPESFSVRRVHEQDHALVLNPFMYELIPGPRVLIPRKNPFAFLFPEGKSYKTFFSKFKHQNKPRRQLQFHTLLEPTACRSILEDVLKDYGCTKIDSSKKSDNRYRIKCSSTGETVNSAILTVFKVDKGLSGVHFESDSSDPHYLQGMYSAVTRGFRAKASLNVNSERESNDA